MAAQVYRSRSVKPRKRRTHADSEKILEAVTEIVGAANGPITIRHLFYRLVSRGLLKKSEQEYRNLGNYLTRWRESGRLHWSAFADNTRWYYTHTSYDNMAAALETTIDNYRRNLWQSQGSYVEIWCEKDAIASILYKEASSWGVPVFPLRGFPSGTALHNAADIFKAQIRAGKEVYIYYFGDHDPSGTSIDASTISSLNNVHNVDINFERVAVLPAQIEEYDLPTRPTKKSDTRSKTFEGESVEIDAMDMEVLRDMVKDCIVRHINPQTWSSELAIEEQERATLKQMMGELMGVA